MMYILQVLKIQPQSIKSSYIKLIVLMCSLVYSTTVLIFLQTTITAHDGINAYTCTSAIAPKLTSLIVYVIGYFIIMIAFVMIDDDQSKTNSLLDIIYFTGGMMYYIARNLSIPVVQPILLGMVVVFYRFIPLFISKYYQSNLAKEHQTTEAKLQLVPEWILAAESLTLLVEFDALYTLIVNFLSKESGCTSNNGIGAFVLWALFVFMYMIILYYTMNIQYCDDNITCSCFASKVCAILLLIAFGMYLMTSNGFPLGCFGEKVRIAWIVMKILVLIVVVVVTVLLLVSRCLSKTRKEKLLPHTLYQHLHPEQDTKPPTISI